MPIGTPVLIDENGRSSAGTSLVLTVPAGGVPAGSTMFLCSAIGGENTSFTVADSAGNTWVQDYASDDHGTSDHRLQFFRASNVAALVSGDTITLSWSSSSTGACSAFYVTGLDDSAPLDQTAAPAQGTNNAPTSGDVTTTAADEIMFGMLSVGAARTVTEDGDYTTIADNNAEAGGNFSHVGYRIVSATETNNYAATLSSNGNWHAALLTYKAAGGTPAARKLMLLGVGT